MVEYRIAEPNDLRNIYVFAEADLHKRTPDSMERMFQVWNSRFREESLQHYLKLGWSFVAIENNQIRGFFLGQPILFFQGMTQTLWIEFVLAEDQQIQTNLIDIAIKLAKDKHFQQVVLSERYKQNFPFQQIIEPTVWIKTTK